MQAENERDQNCSCDYFGGCISLIQPCDTVINTPFKDHVNSAAEKHHCEDLDKWTIGTFTARERSRKRKKGHQ